MTDTTNDRPNILLILTDDQGPWAMGNAGNNEISTPNLDRIASTGTRFENFFCTSPVCSPARASIFTGRIPSQHGVHDWLAAGNTIAAYEKARDGELTRYLEGQAGYTDFLSRAGYRCGLSGKWHLGDAHHPQMGFEYWNVHAKGGGPYYHAPMVRGDEVYEEPGYVTDVITDNAIDRLNELRLNHSDEPFYLSVHYTAPHSPWDRDQHPESTYRDYFDHCAFDSLPDGLSAPEWVRYTGIPCEDAEARRAMLSGYFAAVTEMDRNVGRLLDWLEAANLRERTLVIFLSDNGMNMGHHGVYGKGNATFPLNMFEESVKVPFLVSQPGTVPAGIVRSDLRSQYDIFPTLLEYAGISTDVVADAVANAVADTVAETVAETGVELPGTSFARSLTRGDTGGHEQLVVFDEYGPVRMIRTTKYKYVHRYAYGPNELYDLDSDPGETVNLAGTDSARPVEHEMRDRLFEWFRSYVDPKLDGSREVVTGAGQWGRCGAYAGGRKAFSANRIEEYLY